MNIMALIGPQPITACAWQQMADHFGPCSTNGSPLRAAIEPRDTLVGFLRRAGAEHLVAQLRCWPARVVEVAIDPGHDLDARSAKVPLLNVGLEGGRQI